MLTDAWLLHVPSVEALTRGFGAGTVLVAIGVSVPQFVRLWRGGTAAGVSLPAVLNSAISFLAWTMYALWIGDTWLIASSAVGLPFAAATAVAAWWFTAQRTGLWLSAVWVAVLLGSCAIQAVSGWELVRLTVGASIGWLVVPAVVQAWRSHDVSGLAAGSWWVLSAEGILFLGYGLGRGVGASVVYGLVAMAGSAAVLARLALGDRRVIEVDLLPLRLEPVVHLANVPGPRFGEPPSPLEVSPEAEGRLTRSYGSGTDHSGRSW